MASHGRYQVLTDCLTERSNFDRRYAVVDAFSRRDDVGRYLWAVLQTNDEQRAREYAAELNAEGDCMRDAA